MSSPCETCAKHHGSCPGCKAWREYYVQRQNAINAYARKLTQRLASTVTPCDTCANAETCITPCTRRLRHWDSQMNELRRLYGQTENVGDDQALYPQLQSENPPLESSAAEANEEH